MICTAVTSIRIDLMLDGSNLSEIIPICVYYYSTVMMYIMYLFLMDTHIVYIAI